MCGIAGIISLDGTSLGEREFRAMAGARDAMRHRGPDDEGFAVADSALAALAHRRLSIIDPTPEAHQPMQGRMGTSLAFNGEIYNYRELKSRYALDVPPSDTAVLLTLLEMRGMAILPELRGFFSFAWWNDSTRELMLARDAIGKKPLYYGEFQKRFVFASELRALVASGIVPVRVSRRALGEYLQFYSVPNPDSMLEGVQMLPPGSVLVLSENGNVSIRRWYRLPEHHPVRIDYEDACRESRRLLERSVRDRLVSDVPVGAFLSGGLDSNAIVALAARESSAPIETFTLGFDTRELDESSWAQMAANAYGAHHRSWWISENDIAHAVPEFFSAMDSPSGDGLNSFLISRFARAANPALKVILSGVGGDEAFLGYAKYRWLAKRASMLNLLWSLPRSMRSNISERILDGPHSRIRSGIRSTIAPEDSRRLFGRNEIFALTGFSPPEHSFDAPETDPLLALLRSDIEHYLPDMLLRDLDAMTMSQSIEGRAPLLDRELLEFTWQLPLAIKTRGATKALLADAVRDIVPPEILHKPKTGFELPMRQWLLTILRPHLDLLVSDSLRIVETGLLQKEAVRKIHREFLAGRSHYLKPWSIIALEYWLRSLERIASERIASEPRAESIPATL